MEFNHLGKSVNHPQTPEEATLETFENQYKSRNYLIQFDCQDFTSLCPVTGQPDFAKISIQYIPDERCVETKSLKYYLHSFRNFKGFNEKIVNTILDDFVKVCKPRWIQIKGQFAARGGIVLTTTAEYPSMEVPSLRVKSEELESKE